MAEKNFLSDINIDGKIKVNTVPNSTGTVITYNATTKELSTRTNSQIINDLGIVTDPQLGDYITKNSGNSILNSIWNIASESGEGSISFTDDNFFKINWGTSSTTFTDEGMIDLVGYGIRQAENQGTNQIYSNTYFKNVNFTNSQGTKPFEVISNTLITNLNADFLDGKHASEFILTSHPSYTITNSELTGWRTYLGYSDNRNISPLDIPNGKIQFGIGSFNNNETNPYSDWIHFGGYNDSTAGRQNLVMFNKIDFGLRQYQGTFQSPTAYNSYVDYWHSGNFIPGDYVKKNTTLTINGITQDLSANRTWNINTNFISKEVLSGRTLADANNPTNGTDFYFTNGLNKPTDIQDGVLQSYSFDNNLWYSQMFSDWRTNNWYIRTKNQGSWLTWKKLLHSGDITQTMIDNWNNKFKTLRYVTSLEEVTESGIYRQAEPSSGFYYTSTLNLNADDSRQQITIHREGTGMKFRSSTSGANNTGWSSWRRVFNDHEPINYEYGIENIITVGETNWLQRNILSRKYNDTYGDYTEINAPGFGNNNASFILSANGNGYLGGNRIWHTGNFNPSNYLQAWENAVSVGFVAGSSTLAPYVYHNDGTYVHLATQGWVAQNFAVRDGSNATNTWNNASFGLINNPSIPGKIKNASGDSDLIHATHGSVMGMINTAGKVNGNPTDDWHHRIKMLHDNALGFFTEISVQMGGGSSMWYKNMDGGNEVDWIQLLDTNNFNSNLYVTTNTIQNITAHKTFTDGLKSNTVIEGSGLQSNTDPNPNMAWTTDGGYVDTGTLGKKTIQFRYWADGSLFAPTIPDNVNFVSIIFEGGTGPGSKLRLPNKAKSGLEVNIINFSDWELAIHNAATPTYEVKIKGYESTRFVFIANSAIGDETIDVNNDGLWGQAVLPFKTILL